MKTNIPFVVVIFYIIVIVYLTLIYHEVRAPDPLVLLNCRPLFGSAEEKDPYKEIIEDVYNIKAIKGALNATLLS